MMADMATSSTTGIQRPHTAGVSVRGSPHSRPTSRQSRYRKTKRSPPVERPPVPAWMLDTPMHSKIPMVDAPSGKIMLYTTGLCEKLQATPTGLDFDSSPQGLGMTYRSLHDPHLKGYFTTTRMSNHLMRSGFLSPCGMVKCGLKEFNEYHQYIKQVQLEQLTQTRKRMMEKNQSHKANIHHHMLAHKKQSSKIPQATSRAPSKHRRRATSTKPSSRQTKQGKRREVSQTPIKRECSAKTKTSGGRILEPDREKAERKHRRARRHSEMQAYDRQYQILSRRFEEEMRRDEELERRKLVKMAERELKRQEQWDRREATREAKLVHETAQREKDEARASKVKIMRSRMAEAHRDRQRALFESIRDARAKLVAQREAMIANRLEKRLGKIRRKYNRRYRRQWAAFKHLVASQEFEEVFDDDLELVEEGLKTQRADDADGSIAGAAKLALSGVQSLSPILSSARDSSSPSEQADAQPEISITDEVLSVTSLDYRQSPKPDGQLQGVQNDVCMMHDVYLAEGSGGEEAKKGGAVSPGIPAISSDLGLEDELAEGLDDSKEEKGLYDESDHKDDMASLSNKKSSGSRSNVGPQTSSAKEEEEDPEDASEVDSEETSEEESESTTSEESDFWRSDSESSSSPSAFEEEDEGIPETKEMETKETVEENVETKVEILQEDEVQEFVDETSESEKIQEADEQLIEDTGGEVEEELEMGDACQDNLVREVGSGQNEMQEVESKETGMTEADREETKEDLVKAKWDVDQEEVEGETRIDDEGGEQEDKEKEADGHEEEKEYLRQASDVVAAVLEGSLCHLSSACATSKEEQRLEDGEQRSQDDSRKGGQEGSEMEKPEKLESDSIVLANVLHIFEEVEHEIHHHHHHHHDGHHHEHDHPQHADSHHENSHPDEHNENEEILSSSECDSVCDSVSESEDGDDEDQIIGVVENEIIADEGTITSLKGCLSGDDVTGLTEVIKETKDHKKIFEGALMPLRHHSSTSTVSSRVSISVTAAVLSAESLKMDDSGKLVHETDSQSHMKTEHKVSHTNIPSDADHPKEPSEEATSESSHHHYSSIIPVYQGNLINVSDEVIDTNLSAISVKPDHHHRVPPSYSTDSRNSFRNIFRPDMTYCQGSAKCLKDTLVRELSHSKHSKHSSGEMDKFYDILEEAQEDITAHHSDEELVTMDESEGVCYLPKRAGYKAQVTGASTIPQLLTDELPSASTTSTKEDEEDPKGDRCKDAPNLPAEVDAPPLNETGSKDDLKMKDDTDALDEGIHKKMEEDDLSCDDGWVIVDSIPSQVPGSGADDGPRADRDGVRECDDSVSDTEATEDRVLMNGPCEVNNDDEVGEELPGGSVETENDDSGQNQDDEAHLSATPGNDTDADKNHHTGSQSPRGNQGRTSPPDATDQTENAQHEENSNENDQIDDHSNDCHPTANHSSETLPNENCPIEDDTNENLDNTSEKVDLVKNVDDQEQLAPDSTEPEALNAEGKEHVTPSLSSLSESTSLPASLEADSNSAAPWILDETDNQTPAEECLIPNAIQDPCDTAGAESRNRVSSNHLQTSQHRPEDLVPRPPTPTPYESDIPTVSSNMPLSESKSSSSRKSGSRLSAVMRKISSVMSVGRKRSSRVHPGEETEDDANLDKKGEDAKKSQ